MLPLQLAYVYHTDHLLNFGHVTSPKWTRAHVPIAMTSPTNSMLCISLVDVEGGGMRCSLGSQPCTDVRGCAPRVGRPANHPLCSRDQRRDQRYVSSVVQKQHYPLVIKQCGGMGRMVSVAAISSRGSCTQRSNRCYAQNLERLKAETAEALPRVWGASV